MRGIPAALTAVLIAHEASASIQGSRLSAIPVNPSTSSNSRYGTSPPSELTLEPWNSSLSAPSKPTRRASLSASPIASLPFAVLGTEESLYLRGQTIHIVDKVWFPSGKSGIRTRNGRRGLDSHGAAFFGPLPAGVVLGIEATFVRVEGTESFESSCPSYPS